MARPLRDAPSGDSWAIADQPWQACRTKPKDRISHNEFLQQIGGQLVDPIPDFRLPNAGHSVRFLDLLGWLSRDHDCRYRVYNEWREPDADSGTGRLHRDDASFLLRLVMGLVDAEEKPLSEAHRSLLADQESVRNSAKRLSRSIEASFPLLRDRLGLTDEECGNDPHQVGGLFPTKAREVVSSKVESLEGLSQEIRDGSKAKELYDASLKAAQAVAIAEDGLSRTEELKKQSEAELKQCEQSSAEQYRKQFSPARNCPAKDECPLLHPVDDNGKPDPEREARIADLRQTIDRQSQEIDRLRDELPGLREQSETAQSEYQAAQENLTKSIQGISGEIGRWELLVEQADQYESWLKELSTANSRLEALQGEIERSLQTLGATRERQSTRLKQLSDFFDWTLKELLGPDAAGAIQIDAKGLHPDPGESVAAHGAALSTLATVIGLDLACLTASVCGLGHHPRFIIHDSPREAELESVLFDRIFQLMHDLEAHFAADQEPSFQYIITTSSPVPDAWANEPYTRLILDKRDAATMLLRQTF